MVAARAVRRVAAGLSLAFVLAAGALAQDAAEAPALRPVLLELFTAQGCAACPPADDMMLELASREDVIALALHVDYWDYIGWADTFADRAHTERQQRYARRHGQSTIYTPQVVINGTEIVEGYRVMQVMGAIDAQRARPADVTLDLRRVEGGGIELRADRIVPAEPVVAMASRRAGMALAGSNAVVGTLAMGESAPSAPPPVAAEAVDPSAVVVQLVLFQPEAEVEILDGENAGRVGRYANIVTSWQAVGTWDMRMPLRMTLPADAGTPAVVILQEAGQGEIVAAARLR